MSLSLPIWQMYRRAMMARDAAEHMVTTCHNFGILKVEMRQMDRAAELFNKALQFDPFHIPTCLSYGEQPSAKLRVLVQRCIEVGSSGRRSTNAFAQARMNEFGFVECHFIAGRLLLETKEDLEGSERMYTRALRRNPGHLHALIGYAHLAQIKGDMAEAEEFYARALDFHENSLDAIMHLGLFYELAKRDIAQADAMYSRAQEIDAERARDKYDTLLPRQVLNVLVELLVRVEVLVLYVVACIT